MKDMNNTFDKKIKDMNDTFEREVRAKDDSIQKLEKEMKAKDDSIQNLAREVCFLKDPPYTYYSSSQDSTTIISQTISYSSLLHSSTNVEGGDMNISTGIFTSGWGGTYTVSWSLWGGAGKGHHVNIYLRRNAAKITESRHHS